MPGGAQDHHLSHPIFRLFLDGPAARLFMDFFIDFGTILEVIFSDFLDTGVFGSSRLAPGK